MINKNILLNQNKKLFLIYFLILSYIPNFSSSEIHNTTEDNETIKIYTNCNIMYSKLIYIFLENFNLLYSPDLSEEKYYSSSIKSYFTILKSFEILNKPLYSNYKCPYNCTKTFTKKDFSILHYHIYHLHNDLLLTNEKCLSDYCNIFDCNRIKDYITNYNDYLFGHDSKFEGYSLINQRLSNCNEELIPNYKLLCLALLDDLPFKYQYCSALSCQKNDAGLYNNFSNSLLFIKFIIGIFVGVFSFVYLVIIWINKFL